MYCAAEVLFNKAVMCNIVLPLEIVVVDVDDVDVDADPCACASAMHFQLIYLRNLLIPCV